MYIPRYGDVHTLYLKFHHYAATTLHTQDPFRRSLTCVQKVAAASLIQAHQKSDGGLTKPSFLVWKGLVKIDKETRYPLELKGQLL